MLLALMSDLHDNVSAWQLLLREFSARGITTLINCGDTCALAMLMDMSATFPGKIHTIFGNVTDRKLEAEVMKDLPNVTHYGDQGDVTLDGRQIYFNHFPKNAEAKAKSGDYDMVCHGHTHLKRWEPSTTRAARVLGNTQKEHMTMILNPGTAGGMFQYPSFSVVDLQTMQHEFIDLIT